jgi:hypothetical protein
VVFRRRYNSIYTGDPLYREGATIANTLLLLCGVAAATLQLLPRLALGRQKEQRANQDGSRSVPAFR